MKIRDETRGHDLNQYEIQLGPAEYIDNTTDAPTWYGSIADAREIIDTLSPCGHRFSIRRY